MAESGLNCYANLALRGLAMMSKDDLKAVKVMLENRDERAGVSGRQKDVYRSEDFVNALNLVALEEYVSNEDWLARCFVTAFLLKLLRIKGFFEGFGQAKELREEQLSVGNVLLQVRLSPKN